MPIVKGPYKKKAIKAAKPQGKGGININRNTKGLKGADGKKRLDEANRILKRRGTRKVLF
jgi:hypothetical protein